MSLWKRLVLLSFLAIIINLGLIFGLPSLGQSFRLPLSGEPVSAPLLAQDLPTEIPPNFPASSTLAPTNPPPPTAETLSKPAPGLESPLTQVQALSPTSLPPDLNPLTGLRVSDPSLLERRPMAIKITNFPRGVRPQWGLSLADVGYEYYLEDGLTRFIALFYGNDAPRVGPVRSARFFDEHIFRMYQAIFVFANADRRVLDHLLETEFVNTFVVERPDNCPPLCRDRSNRVFNAYNNLIADTRYLNQYVSERGAKDFTRPDLGGMQFQVPAPQGGLPATSAEIHYSIFSYNRWEYDLPSGRYLRWQETQDDGGQGGAFAPLTDSLTGLPIAAENVIVLSVPHELISERPEIVDIQLLGTGPAYILRDGRIYQAIWVRSSFDSLLTLQDSRGRPFPLKPGVTFYQVIGHTSNAWQFGDSWRFDFAIP